MCSCFCASCEQLERCMWGLLVTRMASMTTANTSRELQHLCFIWQTTSLSPSGHSVAHVAAVVALLAPVAPFRADCVGVALKLVAAMANPNCRLSVRAACAWLQEVSDVIVRCESADTSDVIHPVCMSGHLSLQCCRKSCNHSACMTSQTLLLAVSITS